MAIARQWYDERGVEAIFDITNSGVALAIQELAKSRHRLVIFDSASSSDLTGKACSPNGMQWNADNWSNGVALMRLLIKQKLDSFFFITADYAFGASLEADARDAIAKAGGTTLGGVRAPLNTADFSSYLLSAQASGAKVVVLANTGADLSTSLKQANEFGVAPAQYIATPITYLSDVNALGLAIAHDLVFMQSWYWDLDDAKRALAKRFYARTKRMPNDNQAVLYSSVRHYLEAVATRRNGRRACRRQGDARRADPRRLHRQRPYPRGRTRRLRPLSHEGEDASGVEISLGLSDGPRQNSRRRGVPPAGRRRLHAGRALERGAKLHKMPLAGRATTLAGPVDRKLSDGRNRRARRCVSSSRNRVALRTGVIAVATVPAYRFYCVFLPARGSCAIHLV